MRELGKENSAGLLKYVRAIRAYTCRLLLCTYVLYLRVRADCTFALVLHMANLKERRVAYVRGVVKDCDH